MAICSHAINRRRRAVYSGCNSGEQSVLHHSNGGEMADFDSLTWALDAWFDRPLGELPEALRQRVQQTSMKWLPPPRVPIWFVHLENLPNALSKCG